MEQLRIRKINTETICHESQYEHYASKLHNNALRNFQFIYSQ